MICMRGEMNGGFWANACLGGRTEDGVVNPISKLSHYISSRLEVKLFQTVDSKRWFKQGRKWESCSMNLGLGSTGESSNICHCLNNRISYLRKKGCMSPYRFGMSVSVSFLSAQ